MARVITPDLATTLKQITCSGFIAHPFYLFHYIQDQLFETIKDIMEKL